MSAVALGRIVTLVREKANDRDFRIGLEAIESGTGRLVSDPVTDYEGDGLAFEPGDVLFGKLRPYLAKAWLADTAGAAVGDFHVYRPKRSDVEPAYLRYLLLARTFIDLVAASVFGAKMPRADWDFIRTVEIHLPDLPKQRLIADYLDRETAQIDALIEEQQRLIEMLRERRVATIAAGLVEVSGHSTRLKYVAEVQTGITLSGEGDAEDQEWPYLRVANVQVGLVDLTEIKTIRVSESTARASMLLPGDVLMTEGGDIDKLGRGALWRGEVDDMLHQNHIFAVRPGVRLDPEFFVYWLDGPIARYYFRTTAKKTTNLASTNRWTLGNLPLECPPIGEQRATAARLEAETAKIDELIAETERFIELSRERRDALITAAVTGQIDVRDQVGAGAA